MPWNSDRDNLGLRHMHRTRRTATGWLCQVCGLRFTPTERAVLFGTMPTDPAYSLSVPAVGEAIPEGAGIHAMDHGLLHRECARIAAAWCPALKDLRSAGELLAFSVSPGSIEAFGDEAVRLDLAAL